MSAFSAVISAMKWFGTTPEMRSNHHAESRVSTSPFRGMPVGITTSSAEIRSVATMSSRSPRSYVSRTFPRCARFGRSLSSITSGMFPLLRLQVEHRDDGRHEREQRHEHHRLQERRDTRQHELLRAVAGDDEADQRNQEQRPDNQPNRHYERAQQR